MLNYSVVDDMTSDQVLRSLRSLFLRNAISATDAGEIVTRILKRKDFTPHQIERLQSGVDMPEVMPSAINLVIADRELLQAIKEL